MSALAALIRVIAKLANDARGTAVIETAIVAPALVCLTLGGFEASRIVAQQHELQAGAGDAQQIVLAAASGTATDTPTIKTALVNSLGLSADKVDVTKLYRCGTDNTLSSTSCASGSWQSIYVKVSIHDSYTPLWTSFGVGGPVNFNVERMIQVSSAQVT
jgi:Flp pilus assembly protein TadG